MKEILNYEIATVSYDEISNSIIVVWKKPPTTEGYKVIFLEMLSAMSTYNVDALISDIFQQGIIDTESRTWLQNEILPKACKRGLKKIATVTPNDVFSKYYLESLKNAIIAKSLDLDIQFFDELISAQAWVMSEEVPA